MSVASHEASTVDSDSTDAWDIRIRPSVRGRDVDAPAAGVLRFGAIMDRARITTSVAANGSRPDIPIGLPIDRQKKEWK